MNPRPPAKRKRAKKVLMALRFEPDVASFIRRRAIRENITQARVVEIALTVNGKSGAVKLGVKP